MLDRHNAKWERRPAEDGVESDEGAYIGEDLSGDERRNQIARTAAEAAAKKAKLAAAERQKSTNDVKISLTSVKQSQTTESGRGFGGVGDLKTGRAAASLFGPLKAAEQEEWIDLPFYDPTVGRNGLLLPSKLID